MTLAPDALNRLLGATFTAEVVANISRFMCEKANITGAVSSQLTLDFQKPEDIVAPGDVVPVLTITLRPATINVTPAQPQSERGAVASPA